MKFRVDCQMQPYHLRYTHKVPEFLQLKLALGGQSFAMSELKDTEYVS